MSDEWRPTARPSWMVRLKTMFWAWLKQQARLRAFQDKWRSGL